MYICAPTGKKRNLNILNILTLYTINYKIIHNINYDYLQIEIFSLK